MLEYLFYLFVFLLPWQTIFLLREIFVGGEKWQYGTVGIYASDISLIILLILSFIDYFKKHAPFFCHPRESGDPVRRSIDITLDSRLHGNDKHSILRFILLALVAWSFLSILWSPDKILAFYFSLKLFLAAGLFFAVKSAGWRINFKKVIFILILGASLQSILGIGQFLTQNTFSSKWLGMSAYNAAQGGVSVLENSSGRWLRAYGGMTHPNILGGYLAIILSIVLIYKFTSSLSFPRRRESSISQKPAYNFRIPAFARMTERALRNSKKIILYTLYSILLSGLIVSFSRSAWLVFTIGLFLIFIFQKEKRKELGKIIFIFLLTSLIWLSAFSPLFFSRVSGKDRLEKKSIDDRTEYISQAKELIKNNFLLGVGAGNYTKEVAEKNPKKTIWQIQPVHNVFLLIWSELGIIGFSLFLTLLWQIFKKINPRFYFIFFAFFILMFFDHWLWTSHFGILFFFLMMGIINKYER